MRMFSGLLARPAGLASCANANGGSAAAAAASALNLSRSRRVVIEWLLAERADRQTPAPRLASSGSKRVNSNPAAHGCANAQSTTAPRPLESEPHPLQALESQV